MKINFTKAQYERLVRLIHYGSFMLNPENKYIESDKNWELEQYIASFAKDFHMEHLFEKDIDGELYFSDYIENEFGQDAKDKYDDICFWSELIDRLKYRELSKKFPNGPSKENEDLYMEEEFRLIQLYSQEFEKNGLDNFSLNLPTPD